MYQQFKTILYHGTISEIGQVDVSRGRGNKDFGKGFYMAVTRQQAIGMMHKKYKEAVRRSRNKGVSGFTERLYEIRLNEDIIKTLNIKVFGTADVEWLEFVLLCRERGCMSHDYDLVIGPTANGFKWSPKNGCWQRQITDNARYSVKRLKEEFDRLAG